MPTIIFEIETEYGSYRDALYLPDDVTYTEQEIDDMKNERVQNWIAAITATTE